VAAAGTNAGKPANCRLLRSGQIQLPSTHPFGRRFRTPGRWVADASEEVQRWLPATPIVDSPTTARAAIGMDDRSQLIERDRYYMSLAEAVEKGADCLGTHVGAVLVRQNRVISTGYNGTPSGFPNCKDGGCIRCR
jgi:deoxycytidylate deaminase